ncbi:MAG: sugar O-acyltransferase (sialic acid O-acetyltransferase NeuD family) [Cyclobacteriaceae bacterium]
MKAEEVIIIGAGGHSAELDDYINLYNNHSEAKIKILGYLDDDLASHGKYSFQAPLLGQISDHEIRQDCKYMIGIANLKYRRFFVEKFLESGGKFLSFVHPTSLISPSCQLDEGVVIGPNANVGPNAHIGAYTLINSRCSIGHDCSLGKYNFISPNVCFSGFTSIGDSNLFGINAATIPNIHIGNDNTIAAGMVIHKDVTNSETVFYRYKERLTIVKK